MLTGKILRQLLLAVAVLAYGTANSTTLVLPAANPMSVGTYNSFNVYSFDLLAQCAAALDPRCLPSGPFPVASSPGKIKDEAVVLAQAAIHNNDGPFTPADKVDDVFNAVTGVTGRFTMTETDGSFGAGDIANRWDISVSLLKNYLNAHDLVFLFDNNQQGNSHQYINIWAQARIVDASGNTISCFELSTFTTGCATPLNTEPAPADSAYVTVAGDFCVDKTTGASHALPCGANDYPISNNLSTSQAEFAGFNQALNDAVLAAGNQDNFLSINLKYFGDNAGAEQLWICSECTITKNRQVPEPSSLALFAIALLGFGARGVRAGKQR